MSARRRQPKRAHESDPETPAKKQSKITRLGCSLSREISISSSPTIASESTGSYVPSEARPVDLSDRQTTFAPAAKQNVTPRKRGGGKRPIGSTPNPEGLEARPVPRIFDIVTPNTSKLRTIFSTGPSPRSSQHPSRPNPTPQPEDPAAWAIPEGYLLVPRATLHQFEALKQGVADIKADFQDLSLQQRKGLQKTRHVLRSDYETGRAEGRLQREEIQKTLQGVVTQADMQRLVQDSVRESSHNLLARSDFQESSRTLLTRAEFNHSVRNLSADLHDLRRIVPSRTDLQEIHAAVRQTRAEVVVEIKRDGSITRADVMNSIQREGNKIRDLDRQIGLVQSTFLDIKSDLVKEIAQLSKDGETHHQASTKRLRDLETVLEGLQTRLSLDAEDASEKLQTLTNMAKKQLPHKAEVAEAISRETAKTREKLEALALGITAVLSLVQAGLSNDDTLKHALNTMKGDVLNVQGMVTQQSRDDQLDRVVEMVAASRGDLFDCYRGTLRRLQNLDNFFRALDQEALIVLRIFNEVVAADQERNGAIPDDSAHDDPADEAYNALAQEQPDPQRSDFARRVLWGVSNVLRRRRGDDVRDEPDPNPVEVTKQALGAMETRIRADVEALQRQVEASRVPQHDELAEAHMRRLQGQIDDAEARRGTAERSHQTTLQELADIRDAYDQAQTQHQEQERLVESLRAQVADTAARLTTSEQSHDTTQQELASIREVHDQASAQLQEADTQRQEHVRIAEGLRSQITDTEARLITSEQSHRSTQQELANIQDAHHQADAQRQQAETERQELEHVAEGLRGQITDIQARLNIPEQSHATTRREVANIRNAHHETDTGHPNLTDENDLLVEEKATLEKRLAEKQAQLEALQRWKEEFEGQIRVGRSPPHLIEEVDEEDEFVTPAPGWPGSDHGEPNDGDEVLMRDELAPNPEEGCPDDRPDSRQSMRSGGRRSRSPDMTDRRSNERARRHEQPDFGEQRPGIGRDGDSDWYGLD